jgi:hypothetical protein
MHTDAVSCPSCNHDNPAGANFCNRCGAPVHFITCEGCDAVNDRDARRCYKCGARLPRHSAMRGAAYATAALVLIGGAAAAYFFYEPAPPGPDFTPLAETTAPLELPAQAELMPELVAPAPVQAAPAARPAASKQGARKPGATKSASRPRPKSRPPS